MKKNPLPKLVRMMLFGAGILESYVKTLSALEMQGDI